MYTAILASNFCTSFNIATSAGPQTVMEAGIEPKIVATTALAVIGSNHLARSQPQLG
jgi:hypothetical protein